MKIKLEPCYPEGTTEEEQIEAVKSEYKEVLKAAKGDDWRELAKELLDLAQTLEGYIDLKEWDWVGCKSGYEFEGDYHTINDIVEHYKGWKPEIDFFTGAFQKVVLDTFVTLVSSHDRNNPNYADELFNQFLDQHYEKLKRRKKEWNGEYLEEKEVI